MITVDKGTFYSGEKGTNKIGVDTPESNNANRRLPNLYVFKTSQEGS